MGDHDCSSGTGDDASPLGFDRFESVTLSPTEHERLLALVEGAHLRRLCGHEQRYLVAGAGSGESYERRALVYNQLDERTNPSAAAFMLEEFGFTTEELRLWHCAFDILCGRATHIVGVLEDLDGGYVWELGLLFAPAYRDAVWILKRYYRNPERERAAFDNGMAISHVEMLLTSNRCFEWQDVDELRVAVSQIP